MIKEIKFKNMFDEEFIVSFKEGVNLIVGPKGGGKSSLLNLLCGADSGIVSKDLQKYFVGDSAKGASIKPDKVIYSHGEEKSFNSLQSLKKKEVEKEFDSKMSIIRQNDRFKSALDESKDIEKTKKAFAEKIIREENNIDTLYNDIISFRESMDKFYEMQRENINWENIFKFKSDNNNESQLFLELKYNGNDITSKINKISLNIKTHINELKKIKKYIELLDVDVYSVDKELLSDGFTDKSLETDKTLLKAIDESIKLFEKELIALEKREQAIKSFDFAYKSIIKKIKEDDFNNAGMSHFKIQAENYFYNAGRVMKNSKIAFDNLVQEDYKVDINQKINDELLGYEIEPFELEDDELFEIMNSLMYVSKTKTEYVKWIEQLMKKGHKDTRGRETFDKQMVKILIKKIKVLAGDNEYINMSPGQKSIFGIKYKLLKANENDILFIDQPEDNLDNHTIAQELLDLLKNSKHKQIFIVTHNANLGILTNPSNVIVADLSNEEEPYQTTNYSNIQENPKAYFLEGGTKNLEQRYKLIKGEE